VDLDHKRHKRKVKNNPEEAEHEITIEHEDALILPRVVTLQVDRVQQVLEERADHSDKQDGVLEAEHQLDRGALDEGVCVGGVDEVHVEEEKEGQQTDDAQVE